MFQLGQLQGPRGSKKHLMIIDSELLKYKFGPHEDQIRAKLCRPLQGAYEVGLSIIICFWKAQDEPYRCYEDSVIRNRSQQAQNQPSILLRADLSWTRAGRQAELRGPLQKAYGVGSSIIICFRKAQDEPYRCYEDSVIRNRSQQAQNQPSILLRADLSWTRAGRQAELRGPLQKAYGVGSSIIICFRKAQDEPYRCYEDFVLRNRSQQARI
jgi:hypothetical protein